MVALSILLSVLFQALWATTQQLPFQSPTTSSTLLDVEFESWLRETGQKWGMKGVSIAVTRRVKDENGEWGDWQTELKGYGVADRWGTPTNEETLFAIGSNTKLFTALGLGFLVQDDAYALQWDTRIKDILPGEWVLHDKVAEKHATLIDILSHQSGLPNHDLSYSSTDTLKSLVSKLRYLRPSSELRQGYQYNNQMYCTSGYIIEKLTNQTYVNFITEKIIKPLGLEDSSYDAAAAIKSGKLADGFLPVPVIENRDAEATDDSIFKPVPYFDPLGGHSIIDPAGGIISNVKDLARWLQTLLLLGHHPDTNASIIPPALITKSAQGASIIPFLAEIPEFSPMVYGFGQIKFSFQGHVIVEHSGGTIGHISSISRAPYDHLGIAILTNTQTLLSELIKWKLYEKAFGLKQLNWDSIYQDAGYKPTSFVKNATDSEAVKAPPMLSFRDLAGVYFNQAYGSIALCDFRHPNNKHCSSTVSSVSSALDGLKPDLVASWNKIWSSHILLTHRDRDYFNLRAIKIFPPPFPESFRSDDHKPFAVDTVASNASAKFSYTQMASGEGWRVDGIAVSSIWGAGDGFMKRNGENKDTAEVWFDRVL